MLIKTKTDLLYSTNRIYDLVKELEIDYENIECIFDELATLEAIIRQEEFKGFYKTLCFDEMLYPENEKAFYSIIPEKVFKDLRVKAFNLLLEADNYTPLSLINHWKSIVDGVIPFGYTSDYNLGE